MPAVVQLLDRLANAEESAFLVGWLEAALSGRGRLDPALGVRLVRAYRESGRLDRAREVALSMAATGPAWGPLDQARIAIERALVDLGEGRFAHAESELRKAAREVDAGPRGGGLRERLDLQLVTAQCELAQDRIGPAVEAIRLAEHIADRIDDGPWRTSVGLWMGHILMRSMEPRGAAKAYGAALARAPYQGASAMSALANLATALGCIGRWEEARDHAHRAIGLAADSGATVRHADAFDVLALVEIAGDHPDGALMAIEQASAILGDFEHPTLRFQLAEHRALALAMLGRADEARDWLGRTEKLFSELPTADTFDDQDFQATRARVFEALGDREEAMRIADTYRHRLTDAFVTGSLNLVLGRVALASGDLPRARAAVEQAALSGERRGWVFPEREGSRELWTEARKLGDSRIVRYAERMLSAQPVASMGSMPPPAPSRASIPVPPASRASLAPPPSRADLRIDAPDALVYVTTNDGVVRVKRTELATCLGDAQVVVDTLSHALRVNEREVSLERRRALEPLMVELLRRARDGLSAEEILRAAGGPGPESADAEHRVRVLISRVRDLLGEPTAIERIRDPGEHGKTRYRLATAIKFALIEPLAQGSLDAF
ncbi:MAG: tetratricopeptide repeat protein [Myxococcales bacterium]|nr:tetratricopeptide repeat protein [Myxococcales bacterium]